MAATTTEKTMEVLIGELIRDEDWIDVVSSMLVEAKSGNVSAARWLAERFWPASKRRGKVAPKIEDDLESRRKRLELRIAEQTRGAGGASRAG